MKNIGKTLNITLQSKKSSINQQANQCNIKSQKKHLINSKKVKNNTKVLFKFDTFIARLSQRFHG